MVKYTHGTWGTSYKYPQFLPNSTSFQYLYMNNLYTYGGFTLFFLALFTDLCYILDEVSKVNPLKRNVINIFKMLQEGLFVSRSNWINIFKCHMYLQVLVTQWKKWVTQSCRTLCVPVDYTPPGSSVHGDSPGKNSGVGGHALFQGIFPIQGSNPCLPHCRQILYRLSQQGSPLATQKGLFIVDSLFNFKDYWTQWHETLIKRWFKNLFDSILMKTLETVREHSYWSIS